MHSLPEQSNQLGDEPRMLQGTMRLIGVQSSLDKYIAASDIVISKAGGLTLSEVLSHGKPVLIPLPVPGQEEFNAQYAIQAGAALGCTNAYDFEQTLPHLLDHPHKIKHMAQAALSIAQPKAADQIAAHIVGNLSPSPRAETQPVLA